MSTQLITFQRDRYSNELKTITLPGLRSGSDASLTSIDMAFRWVPWFRRACKLRANAMGRMPLELQNKAGDDVSEEPEYQSVMEWTRSLLYRIEMNLVKHGAAYHLLETNRFGLNHTPRFIPTNSVMPIIDYSDYGVTGFRISMIGNGGGEFPLARVVWIWEPNDESEIAPGSSDGEAALKASGLLYAIDEMANRYMGSGGVPVTAVRVPATVDKPERTKVENWFTQFAGGFRNAFKFLVIDKNTEFETIGSEMRDIMAPELTATQRDNVAVAMGVPPTVIDGKSANFATADSEMTGFYMNTVIPQAEMLEPQLNTQLYQRLGLTLRFMTDELEIMQAMNLAQADSVTKLTGKPIYSIDEGRNVMELEPLPNKMGEWKEEPDPMLAAAATGAAGQPWPGTNKPVAVGKPKPEPDGKAIDPTDQMRTWQSQSLAQVKAGQSPAVGAPFDDELVAASSGNARRRVFENHWPRPKSAAPSVSERAILALEEYNALARGEHSNG